MLQMVGKLTFPQNKQKTIIQNYIIVNFTNKFDRTLNSKFSKAYEIFKYENDINDKISMHLK